MRERARARGKRERERDRDREMVKETERDETERGGRQIYIFDFYCRKEFDVRGKAKSFVSLRPA